MSILENLLSQTQLHAGDALLARLDFISKTFLGALYISGAQGEGASDDIDQAPLYRFDGFDCVTYVNDVLALAFSKTPEEFEKNIVKINYYHHAVRYENRFHFMSIDWNVQNQKNGFVTEVTETIKDEQKNSIAHYAEGEIDKPNWFLHKSQEALAKKFEKKWVKLPYLPIETLMSHPVLLDQFPDASVIEIVRPNWQLREKIGTNLHISHVGLGLRLSPHVVTFRHASSEKKSVVELPLLDYLSHISTNETIKGIHVQAVG